MTRDSDDGSLSSAVKIRLYSASGLHQAYLLSPMTPCAVLSLPGTSQVHVAKAHKESDTSPVWNDVAVFDLDQKPTAVAKPRIHSSTSEGKRKHLEKQRRLLDRAVTRVTSCPIMDPAPAGLAVAVTIFSSTKMRRTLGHATVAVSEAISNPGKPVHGTFPVSRWSALTGRFHKAGTIKVCITSVTPMRPLRLDVSSQSLRSPSRTEGEDSVSPSSVPSPHLAESSSRESASTATSNPAKETLLATTSSSQVQQAGGASRATSSLDLRAPQSPLYRPLPHADDGEPPSFSAWG